MSESTARLLQEIRACTNCSEHLPLGPRPIANFSAKSRILLVGQAPGTRVHETGIPWNDPSGVRLRSWLDVTEDQFYDPDLFAIVPMGFCYPGRGKSGDNPPRPECAPLWMERIREHLTNVEMTILIGQYSINYFLGDQKKRTLTETVRSWRDHFPKYVVLPHPSPRNNIWLKKNEWFEQDLVPELSGIIGDFLKK